MARYIDADALEKEIKLEASEDIARAVIRIIDRQPTADVEEAKHGKWYRHTQKEHGDTCFYCSVCEEMALSDCMVWELTDYCPYCGAKMDGGKKE